MHHARARFYFFFNGKKSASYVIVVMPMRDLDVRVLLVLVLIREGSIDIFRFSVFSGITLQWRTIISMSCIFSAF